MSPSALLHPARQWCSTMRISSWAVGGSRKSFADRSQKKDLCTTETRSGFASKVPLASEVHCPASTLPQKFASFCRGLGALCPPILCFASHPTGNDSEHKIGGHSAPSPRQNEANF